MLRRIAASCVFVLLAAALPPAACAQAAREDPQRRKPTAELARLAPFLGSYTTVMERKGRSLPGTMEIRPVVGGWYLERVNFTRSDDGSIESEIRSLITWDPALGHYRIWRFVQLTPQRKHDGVGRFEGDVFIEEYELERGDADRRILRNRISMTGRDEMRIVNEFEGDDGKVAVRGVITARRTSAAK